MSVSRRLFAAASKRVTKIAMDTRFFAGLSQVQLPVMLRPKILGNMPKIEMAIKNGNVLANEDARVLLANYETEKRRGSYFYRNYHEAKASLEKTIERLRKKGG